MNHSAGLITVVVPVYNMSQYLDRAMETLLKQTYKNYEIILVDDGSTDGGGEKCDWYAKAYAHVTSLHKKNGGLSSARNYGINHAKGRYIIFPDPDDWVSEDYLQGLVDLCDAESDLEVCGHYVVTDDSMTAHSLPVKYYRYSREEALKSAMQADSFCGFAWNKLYHMDIIRNHELLFDEELGMAQDLHFLIRYLMKCECITYQTKPLYFYYQHVGGVTNAPISPRKLSGLITYQKIIEITQDKYPVVAEMAKSTYANMTLQFMYIYLQQNMQDAVLLRSLKYGFRRHIINFLKNKNCGIARKSLGVVAFVSPKASYLVREILHKYHGSSSDE